jgi:hypothetical protein
MASTTRTIAARYNGFRSKEQERIVLDTVGSYRSAMASFAAMKDPEVWYTRTKATIRSSLRQRKPEGSPPKRASDGSGPTRGLGRCQTRTTPRALRERLGPNRPNRETPKDPRASEQH